MVMVPEMSSRHIAADAISALALSLTEDGACPSAQLTVESADAFDAAVLLQDCKPLAMVKFFQLG